MRCLIGTEVNPMLQRYTELLMSKGRMQTATDIERKMGDETETGSHVYETIANNLP